MLQPPSSSELTFRPMLQRLLTSLSLEGEIVKIEVGPERKILHVHMNIICSSPFFRAATKPEWKRYDNPSVDLHDEDVETFNIYPHWLYAGKIDPILSGEHVSTWLAKAYVLGERLMDGAFQNCISDGSMSRAKRGIYPLCSVVNIIYEGTCSPSPVRRLLVDMYADRAGPDWSFDGLSGEFACDLVKAMAAKRSGGTEPSWEGNSECYHVSIDHDSPRKFD